MEMTDISEPLAWSPEFWEENKAECSKLLHQHCHWEKIPMLNNTPLHNLSDRRLVRFRGMVQDIYNPEFYLSYYEVINKDSGETRMESGKYRDVTNLKPNEEIVYESPKNVNSERQTFYCVSIPGMNEWTVEKSCSGDAQTQLSSTSQPSTSCGMIASNESKKRSAEVENECQPENRSSLGEKVARSDSKKKESEFLLNFPIPGGEDKSCLVKAYDNLDAFVLNEMVEVVGFLSVDPAMATFISDKEKEGENVAEMDVDDQEELALNPPPSLVPRIHIVAAKKLSHANPLLPKKCHESWDTVSKSLLSEAKLIRDELMLVLTQLLLGDQLAAEYMLCHLVSTIYLRNDALCLGQLSLNLCNVPNRENYSKRLYDILSLMLPHSHYLPMTINNINKLTFRPKKDYKTNRLTSGILQLSSNTHLVLDETVLTTGQLDSAGVHNITALGHLITQQRVDYDFQFYNMEFQANIPVLTLSEGKSLLPSDVRVKLQPDGSFDNDLDALFAAARHYLKEPLLNRIRQFLTVVKLANYSLSEDMQKVVQEDFVEMRKNNAEGKITADDLHTRLILGRLLSLSYGQQYLTKELWDHACKLENNRKAILASGR